MATMPKCSGWAFWTLGWREPDGLATEVNRTDRRRLRRNVVAIRTPPGLGRKKSQTRRVVRMAGREEFSLRKQNTIPGDWFTTHGDVFAVGTSKMKPFRPSHRT